MKSWILLSLFGLAGVALCWVLFANALKRTDKELLVQLQQLKMDFPNKTEDPRKTKRSISAAQTLLKEFESNHPNSPLLNEARLEALNILRRDPETGDIAMELAKKLLEKAPKGSDPAAQADLYLAWREFQTIDKEGRNSADRKEVWFRNAETIRRRLEGLLTTYPTDRSVAEVAGLMFNTADRFEDKKTRCLILDLVSKNQPDHHLAALANREKLLGKEFVFEFTPVGSKEKRSIKDLRGKVVVLDFWATWCVPCTKEIPGLKELYEKFKGKLEIIGVSRDRNEAELTNFIKAKGIRWPQVFGAEADVLASQWGIELIPTVFLIDRQGGLHSVNASGKLEKLIPQLLGEKTP